MFHLLFVYLVASINKLQLVRHTYQNHNAESGKEDLEIRFRSGRNRRQVIGVDRNVPKLTQFLSSALTLAHPVSPSAKTNFIQI